MDSLERWIPVEKEIESFRFLIADHVPKLSITYAVNKQWDDEEYNNKIPQGFPWNRGIYLIYNDESKLVYIGSAIKDFASRVFMHDENVRRRYIDIIEFPDDAYLPLILALEFFLISRLKPTGNTEFKGYDVPTLS